VKYDTHVFLFVGVRGGGAAVGVLAVVLER